MNNINDFIKTLVSIDKIEGTNDFGHYPFQALSESKDGEITISTLALGGDVISCYKIFKKQRTEGATKMYMSLDFPAGGDIKDDFVMVFSYENKELSKIAIPYNIKTGERLDPITESNHLEKIFNNFKSVISASLFL